MPEHCAAEHASNVCHEAPVLMLMGGAATASGSGMNARAALVTARPHRQRRGFLTGSPF